ncbi:MAG: hypothetical protein ACLRYY_02150 [Anaerobutyricum soehngenii]
MLGNQPSQRYRLGIKTIEIFKENGYNIPSYMRELEWNKDYYGANYIAENTIRSIRKEYEENPETFVIGRDTVKIEAGGADAMKSLNHGKTHCRQK